MGENFYSPFSKRITCRCATSLLLFY